MRGSGVTSESIKKAIDGGVPQMRFLQTRLSDEQLGLACVVALIEARVAGYSAHVFALHRATMAVQRIALCALACVSCTAALAGPASKPRPATVRQAAAAARRPRPVPRRALRRRAQGPENRRLRGRAGAGARRRVDRPPQARRAELAGDFAGLREGAAAYDGPRM